MSNKKSERPVPEKFLDEKLYRKVRARVIEENPETSAYRSAQIVREYKEEGGRIDPKKEKKSGLTRWFQESWSQIIPMLTKGKKVECGEEQKRTESPACRPTVRVNQKTPITLSELVEKHGKKAVLKMARKKEKFPQRRVNWEKLEFYGDDKEEKENNPKSENKSLELIEVKESPKKGKKLRAIFEDESGKRSTVDFGAQGSRDYLLVSNPDSRFYMRDRSARLRLRENYRKRHSNNPNERLALKRPNTPASLSMHILWGDSSNIKNNIRAFKRKYGV